MDVLLLLSRDYAVELSLGDCVVELTPGIVHGSLKVIEHLRVYVLAGGALLALGTLSGGAGGDPGGAVPDLPDAGGAHPGGEAIDSGLPSGIVAGIDVSLRLAVPDVPLAVDDLGRVALQLVHLPGEVGEAPPRAVRAGEGDRRGVDLPSSEVDGHAAVGGGDGVDDHLPGADHAEAVESVIGAVAPVEGGEGAYEEVIPSLLALHRDRLLGEEEGSLRADPCRTSVDVVAPVGVGEGRRDVLRQAPVAVLRGVAPILDRGDADRLMAENGLPYMERLVFGVIVDGRGDALEGADRPDEVQLCRLTADEDPHRLED